jgi:hypothetical protein
MHRSTSMGRLGPSSTWNFTTRPLYQTMTEKNYRVQHGKDELGCDWADLGWDCGPQEAQVVKDNPACPVCGVDYVVIEKTRI